MVKIRGDQLKPGDIFGSRVADSNLRPTFAFTSVTTDETEYPYVGILIDPLR